MSEILMTCPKCGQSNFTRNGLRRHWCHRNRNLPLSQGDLNAATQNETGPTPPVVTEETPPQTSMGIECGYGEMTNSTDHVAISIHRGGDMTDIVTVRRVHLLNILDELRFDEPFKTSIPGIR